MSKKIHRFYTTAIPEGEHITFADERIIHQAHHVLRLEAGEQVILFTDGGDDVVFRITDINKHGILLTREEVRPVAKPARTLIAAIGIPKGDAFEYLTQKLTEIGVHAIVPLISDRTVKQSVRTDRLRIISDEALEQCGGTNRVTIHEPMTLTACVATYPIPAIYFDIDATEPMGMPTDAAVIYIGPEGGWSEDDIAVLKAHAKACTLGPRVLRTETAAITAAYDYLWH